jgi:hypothetical protein
VPGVLPRFADNIFKPGLTSLFGSYSLGPQHSPLLAEINADRLPEHRCRWGCQRDAMTNLATFWAGGGLKGVLRGQKASATFAAHAQRLPEAT